MSAYIVERNHIDYLVFAAFTWGDNKVWSEEEGRWIELDRKQIGQMLWNANTESVSYRYSDSDPFDLPGCSGDAPYLYTESKAAWGHIDPVQVMKACRCLNYQSCEHPEWKESSACSFLNELCITAMAKLPGWDGAEWGAPKANCVRLCAL